MWEVEQRVLLGLNRCQLLTRCGKELYNRVWRKGRLAVPLSCWWMALTGRLRFVEALRILEVLELPRLSLTLLRSSWVWIQRMTAGKARDWPFSEWAAISAKQVACSWISLCYHLTSFYNRDSIVLATRNLYCMRNTLFLIKNTYVAWKQTLVFILLF